MPRGTCDPLPRLQTPAGTVDACNPVAYFADEEVLRSGLWRGLFGYPCDRTEFTKHIL